jgi:hypothetical protein
MSQLSDTTKNALGEDTTMKDVAHNPSPAAGHKAKPNRSRRQRSRLVGAALKDETTLVKISWSKQSQPKADLAHLIEEGQQIVDGYNSEFEAWKADGSPACKDCSNKHAPPCLRVEDRSLRALSRRLLTTYKVELEAASKSSAGGKSSNITTSAKGTAKGKEKATSEAPAQKDTPASASKLEDEKEEERSLTKKAVKKKTPCPRCHNWHSGECAVPKCDRCYTVHWPSRPCQLTDEWQERWMTLFQQCKTTESAAAMGRVFDATFSTSSGGAKRDNGGKGSKRSPEDDPGEGSSTSKKRK